jgi:hypothetical protein
VDFMVHADFRDLDFDDADFHDALTMIGFG